MFQPALWIGSKGKEGEEQEVATLPFDEGPGSKESGFFPHPAADSQREQFDSLDSQETAVLTFG